MKLETLEGQRLAIDSSIWLYHFQNAMRDKEGRTLSNAHILGFLWRILKLLFYGIRPVFVFDGGAPVLKRRTLANRRTRKEGARDTHARTAEKLLAAQLRAAAVKHIAAGGAGMSERARGKQRAVDDEDDDDEVGASARAGSPSNGIVYLDDLRGDSPVPNAPGSSRSSSSSGSESDYDKRERSTSEWSTSAKKPKPATIRERVEAEQKRKQAEEEEADTLERSEAGVKRRKKNIDWHKDQYDLPPLEQPLELIGSTKAAEKGDIRFATDEEIRQLLAQLAPEDLDTSSEAFRSLPVEMQYELVGDARLQSRGTSYKRLQSMLKTAPTAIDFSRAQVAGLKTRNELTQRVLEVTDEIGRAHIRIEGVSGNKGRVEGTRGKEYVLLRNEGVDGGWVLGVRTDGRNADNAIQVEEDEEEEARVGTKWHEKVEEAIRDAKEQERRGKKRKREDNSRPLVGTEAGSDAAVIKKPPSVVSISDDEAANLYLEEAVLEAVMRETRPKTPPPRTLTAGDPDEAANLLKTPGSVGTASTASLQDFGADAYGDLYNMPDLPNEEPGVHPEEERESWDRALREQKSAGSNGNGDTQSYDILDEDTDEDTEIRPQRLSKFVLPSELMIRDDESVVEVDDLHFGSGSEDSPRAERLPSDKAPSVVVISDDEAQLVEEEDVGSVAPSLPVKENTSPPTPPQTSRKVNAVDFAGPARSVASKASVLGRAAPKSIASERPIASNRPQIREEAPPQLPIASSSHAPVKSVPARPIPENADPIEESEPQPLDTPTALAPLPRASRDPSVERASTDFDRQQVHDAIRSTSPSFRETVTGPESPRPPADLFLLDADDHVSDAISEPAPEAAENSEDDGLSDNERRGGVLYDSEHDDVGGDDSADRLFGPDGVMLPTREELEAYEAEAAEEVQGLEQDQDEFVSFLSKAKGRSLLEVQEEVEAEVAQLKAQHANTRRSQEEITQQMVREIQLMLRLFGLPYITAPMEAEAQCAELVQRGLVDGIITDDSDVFLFGGTRVFKNMFNQNKMVECYLLSDLDREMGISRQKLVSLAYLLGSDYTEGLPGVGPVLAMEVLAAFFDDKAAEAAELEAAMKRKQALNGINANGTGDGISNFEGQVGLVRFREWWMQVQMGKDTAEVPDTVAPTADPKRLKSIKQRLRNKVHLSRDWPHPAVLDAYYSPAVDSSDEPFQWGLPDLDSLRMFLGEYLKWSVSKTDQYLLPVIQAQNRRAKTRQTTLDQSGFLGTSVVAGGGSNELFAGRARPQVGSNRLQQVIDGFRRAKRMARAGLARERAGSTAADALEISESSEEENTVSAPVTRGKGRGRGRGRGRGGRGGSSSQARAQSTRPEEDDLPSSADEAVVEEVDEFTESSAEDDDAEFASRKGRKQTESKRKKQRQKAQEEGSVEAGSSRGKRGGRGGRGRGRGRGKRGGLGVADARRMNLDDVDV
ncbi:DNA repair protein rad2 [Tilletia horrida]|uniref:DNA repair protein rad2 n=1 Tax=Tilletia horrida TaxID=155126 RepID=A0AAN6GM07_9BASI|nr:DNA repair protein rad2 [Tilletia horrida]